MIVTLHRYVFRELAKSFCLCFSALTVLVTLGGGAANLLRGESLGALEVARLLVLFIPVAATFVLPVAAMFSTAITYGRMSADNEITACRAAGLNVHRLLWAAVLLGGGVTAVTYYAWNYLIPRFFQVGEAATRADIARIAAGHLMKNKPLPFANFRLHADEVLPLRSDPAQPLVQDLELHRVAFLQFEHEAVQLFGTAEAAVIRFDRADSRPVISAQLTGVRTYSPRHGQYAESQQQPLGPFEVPLPIRERLSFQDLSTLKQYSRNPTQMAEIAEQLRVVRRGVTNMLTYDCVADALSGAQHCCTLRSPQASVELTAERLGRGRKHGDVSLAKVAARVTTGAEVRSYRAERGSALVKDHPTRRHATLVEVELHDVEVTLPDGTVLRKTQERLPWMEVPQSVHDRVAAMSDEELLDPAAAPPLSEAMKADRQKLIAKFRQKCAVVESLIHFRAALAVSCAALVVLAAALGIYFRGSHVLTAFGVSCLPALLAMLVIMAGHNVADHPAYKPFGLALMWGMDLLCLAGAAVAARRLVRQ